MRRNILYSVDCSVGRIKLKMNYTPIFNTSDFYGGFLLGQGNY
jgi:hypothetical protein